MLQTRRPQVEEPQIGPLAAEGRARIVPTPKARHTLKAGIAGSGIVKPGIVGPGLPLEREQQWRSGHSEKLEVWGRPRERGRSRKPYTLRFPGNSLRGAAYRRRYKKLWADQSRQKPCGNMDILARSSVSRPFTEVESVPAYLDEVAALQSAAPCRLAGDIDLAAGA